MKYFHGLKLISNFLEFRIKLAVIVLAVFCIDIILLIRELIKVILVFILIVRDQKPLEFLDEKTEIIQRLSKITGIFLDIMAIGLTSTE